MRIVKMILTVKGLRPVQQFQCRTYCRKLELRQNEPIKYSSSPAARKTAVKVLNTKNTNDVPWYQPISVLTSVAVFLIYFTILREENDIDNELTKTLYDRIEGLEKQQLLQLYKFNKESGKSVEDIERRLKELEAEEKKLVV